MRTLRQAIEGMPLVFDSSVAADLDAILQFEVTGGEPGEYHLRINGGRCTFHLGRAPEAPTLTIATPSHVWLGISSGELSGRDALLDGLYAARGDADLLLRLGDLFPPRSDVSLAGHERPAGPIPLGGMHWMGVAFVPWMILWLGLPPVVVLGTAAAIVAYRVAVRELTWFEGGSLLALVVLALAAGVVPSGLNRWDSASGTLALALVWLAPTAVRAPALSIAYSKWRYVPALWGNATFRHVNAVISLAWGWTFVAQGLLDSARDITPSLAGVLTVIRWLALVPAAVATMRMPRSAPDRPIHDLDRAPARLQAVAAAGMLIAVAAAVGGGR